MYPFTDGSCDPDGNSPISVEATDRAVMYGPDDRTVEIVGLGVGKMHELEQVGRGQKARGATV